jgi:Two component regulator propeller
VAQNELVGFAPGLPRVDCAEGGRERRALIGLLLSLCLAGHLEASAPSAQPGFSEAAWPGEATFQSYGPEEDLMSMGITALAEDREGFLWVGSDLGLYRFDGHHFLNLGSREGLPIGPDSRLWADPRGHVWTSSFAGLFRITGLEVHPASGVNGLPAGPAFSLAWDEHDRAWVAMGASGLFRESASGRFKKVEGSKEPYVVARAPRHGGMLVLRQEGHAELWKEAGLAATWDARDGVPSAVVAATEDGEGRASSRIAVVIPTTVPQRSIKGPPELPRLIAASVWIIGSRTDQEAPGRIRFTADTMPRVSVCSRPNGLPMA